MGDDQEDLSADDPEVSLSIRLTDLDNVEAAYANLVQLNFDQAAFQVVFAQFLPPMVTGPDEARRLADRGYVPAKVVARMVFTPLMVEQTIELLQRQLDRYRTELAQEATGTLEVAGG